MAMCDQFFSYVKFIERYSHMRVECLGARIKIMFNAILLYFPSKPKIWIRSYSCNGIMGVR